MITLTMRRRGPDAQNCWTKGSVALGHCLLQGTPESLEERQPVESPDGKYVIVWDGRLDNRRALLRALQGMGVVPRGNTDPDIVLAAYLTWVEACPTKLLGDFAFVVWDGVRQVLFCARDPVGARPLFFTHTSHRFAFSSEEESLLAVPGVSNRPNLDRVASRLLPSFYRCCDLLQSWLDDVRKLAPGHSITVDAKGDIREIQYFEPRVGEELSFRDDDEFQEAFNEVFSKAVDCRLRATDIPALMMSGGLDSTAVAATMRQLRPKDGQHRISTYSVVSDEVKNCPESRCILDVIDRLVLDANVISVPSVSGLARMTDLESVFFDFAHPIDHSILMTGLVCRIASQQGCRLLLNGVGGDLAMQIPSDYVVQYFKEGKYSEGFRESRAASKNNNFLRGLSPANILLRSGWRHFAGPGLKRFANETIRGKTRSNVRSSMIRPSFAKELRLEQRLLEWQDDVSRAYRQGIQEGHIRAIWPMGLMTGLEGYNRVAGRYGLEFRDPWTDTRVLDFFTRLPLRYKVRHGWTKFAVRKTFGHMLGEQVVTRKDNQHVGWHLIDRMVVHRREWFMKRLRDNRGPLRHFASSESLGDTIRRFEVQGRFEDKLVCYNAAGLDLWLQRLEAGATFERGGE